MRHRHDSESREGRLTTEIAVLNRLGIALAADSAVTISGDGPPKVFDTGDKLFELSCVHPVAAMVNGNLHFLGVPWELLFKEYRDTRRGRAPVSIESWANAFLRFVEKHHAFTDVHTRRWLLTFVTREVKSLWETAIKGFQQAVKERPDADATELVQDLLLAEVEARLKRLAEAKTLTSLEKVDPEEHRADVAALVDEVQKSELGTFGLVDAPFVRLVDLVLRRLFTEVTPSGATGVVVCGYAGSDLFPSLYAVAIDGWVAGRVRYNETHHVEITRDPTPDGRRTKMLGAAISFAQTDVITRLLRGADDRFVDGTEEFLSRNLRDVIPKTLEIFKLGLVDEHGAPADPALVGEFISEFLPEYYRRNAVPEIGDKIEREFRQTISLMPKQELIELAEALVGITAAERKATKDTGTVGGPIDVAFVTRTEGFVWVKRKHYFKAELNPRYLSRVQQRSTAGDGR